MLLEGAPEPLARAEAQVCVRRITEACGQLSRPIEALLRLVNFNRRVLQWETAATDPLVKECWQEAEPSATPESIAFKTDGLPEVHEDRELLRILFSNLLDNAIKFSASRAAPAIELSGCTAGSYVVFSISDNGVGFDRQHARRLFLPLARLHSPGSF